MRGGSFRGAIDEGALALDHGWPPLDYLSLTGVEALVGREILQRAVEIKEEKNKAFWKNLQSVVQNGVARAFGASK